jgi:hypothetical protein
MSHASLLNISNVARECQVERKVVAGDDQASDALPGRSRVPVRKTRSASGALAAAVRGAAPNEAAMLISAPCTQPARAEALGAGTLLPNERSDTGETAGHSTGAHSMLRAEGVQANLNHAAAELGEKQGGL